MAELVVGMPGCFDWNEHQGTKFSGVPAYTPQRTIFRFLCLAHMRQIMPKNLRQIM